MIPKRDKTTDISTEIARGKLFKKRLLKLADEATERFLNSSQGLNEILAAIAEREGFTQVQIQRLVEETNTVAYTKKYKQVKGDNDRRISFDLAQLERVVEEMGDAAPPPVENPNWVKGRPGEGEIQKEASVEKAYIHNPYGNLDSRRDKLMEKKAAQERKEDLEKAERLEKTAGSSMFKIAQSMVRTELINKNANQIFNTMIDDAQWDEEDIEVLNKKANEISQHLSKHGRIRPGFMVSLKQEPQEKIANALLGQHSLLNEEPEADVKVEVPKVAPTTGVSDYAQLINLAKQLKEQQEEAKQLKTKHTKEVGKDEIDE